MTTAPTTARAQFSIQRTYAASIDEAWALWTTKSGIESWWGPDGFDVTVISLDLRPGCDLIYLMTAVAPEQVAFMKRAGMPLTSECKVTYTEVSPLTPCMTTFGPNALAPGTRARCASWTLCLPLRTRGSTLEALARQRRRRGRGLSRHGARLYRCGRANARRRHIPERATVDVRSTLRAGRSLSRTFHCRGWLRHRPSGTRPAHAPCMDIGRDRSCCGTRGRGRLLRHRRSGTRPCLVRNFDPR